MFLGPKTMATLVAASQFTCYKTAMLESKRCTGTRTTKGIHKFVRLFPVGLLLSSIAALCHVVC